MATSGSTDFSLTAREAISRALELVESAVGSTPSAVNAEAAQVHANLMLKTWGANPRLWIMTEGTVTLVASTASYVLTNARRVTSVRRRTGSLDTPLTPLSRQEYYDFPSKSASGMPYSYYFDPQRSTRTLYVINVPDATIAASTTLQYTYLRVMEDIDALDDDIDIPQEWLEAFVWNLAARLLVPYRRYVSDATTAAKIEEHAASLFAILAAGDDEDESVFLQPAY